MFTIHLDNQPTQWQRLLKHYFPDGAKIIDFTYGRGGLWAETDNHAYPVVKCDKVADHCATDVVIKDILTDDYTDLGLLDGGLYDPPYLIGRTSGDYGLSNKKHTLSRDFQGERGFTARHVCNQSVEAFNARIVALNDKAASVIQDGGLLFVKVMDPKHKGQLVPHHINIVNLLSNFRLIDHSVYIRQRAPTWKPRRGLQNLHGHWLIFEKTNTLKRGNNPMAWCQFHRRKASGVKERLELYPAKADFYPTPPELTLALLEHEKFEGHIWECACGKGDISRLLPPYPHDVTSSDLYDHGFGLVGIDFLKTNMLVDNIVTNPPFSRWMAFKLKAIESVRKKAALLGPMNVAGYDIRSKVPPRAIYIVPNNVVRTKLGLKEFGGSLGVAWFVYEKGFKGNTSFVWLNL